MTPLPPPPPSAGPPPAPAWNAADPWAHSKPAGPAPGVLYASHGARLGAFIVDAILLGVVTGALFALLFALAGLSIVARSAGGMIAMVVLFPLLALGLNGVQLAYFAYFWYRGGASPGMRLAGIRVVRSQDGGPITKQQAVLRAFGYWVSGAVMYLGYIWILIDDRRQGWHDKIADTLVVQA